MVRAVLILALSLGIFTTRKVPIYPGGGARPIGPYSPGIRAGDTFYISGQGAIDPGGRMPAGFEDQARVCLRNVKSIVEADNLTLSDIVYAQVYLADMSKLDALDAVWREFFGKSQPARAVLGTAAMPMNTQVEVSAVAVRGGKPWHRIYLPGVTAADPESAFRQLDELRGGGRIAFVNAYLTGGVSDADFEAAWTKRFHPPLAPARAVIRVAALPGGAAIELTGVAVRAPNAFQDVRPRNVVNASEPACAWAGDTLFCSARSAAIPGLNGGIYAGSVELQMRQTMRNLLDGLEEAGMSPADVVATNVYLDDIGEFAKMNAIYAQYFGAAPPTRTTVQPFRRADRLPGSDGKWPKLVEISLVAVR